MRIILHYIYTTLSYTVLYGFTSVLILFILLLNLLGLNKVIHYVLGFWARGVFLILGKRFSVEGRANINKDHKYILMANHSSLFDIPGITAIYPNASWFGKEYLIKIPVFGKLLKIINFIPMKSSDLRNTKFMIEQLIQQTENRTVAIFPEGTRTTNGELNSFRKGFLHVLRASKLDILPVSLVGFYEFKPKNRFYFNYSKRLSAKIHPPILYSEIESLDDKEIIHIVQSKIESALS